MNQHHICGFLDELDIIKEASGLGGHAAEVVGLGMLAKHPIKTLRDPNASEHDRSAAKMETAGLGVLAAPAVHGMYSDRKKIGKGASKAGKWVGDNASKAWKSGRKLIRKIKKASVEKQAGGYDMAARKADVSRGVRPQQFLPGTPLHAAAEKAKKVSALPAAARLSKPALSQGMKAGKTLTQNKGFLHSVKSLFSS